MTFLLLLACNAPRTDESRVPDSGVRYDIDGDGFFRNEECDDNDAASHPGGVEVCDGKDNDCDGHYDEDAENATLSTRTPTATGSRPTTRRARSSARRTKASPPRSATATTAMRT